MAEIRANLLVCILSLLYTTCLNYRFSHVTCLCCSNSDVFTFIYSDITSQTWPLTCRFQMSCWITWLRIVSIYSRMKILVLAFCYPWTAALLLLGFHGLLCCVGWYFVVRETSISTTRNNYCPWSIIDVEDQ